MTGSFKNNLSIGALFLASACMGDLGPDQAADYDAPDFEVAQEGNGFPQIGGRWGGRRRFQPAPAAPVVECVKCPTVVKDKNGTILETKVEKVPFVENKYLQFNVIVKVLGVPEGLEVYPEYASPSTGDAVSFRPRGEYDGAKAVKDKTYRFKDIPLDAQFYFVSADGTEYYYADVPRDYVGRQARYNKGLLSAVSGKPVVAVSSSSSSTAGGDWGDGGFGPQKGFSRTVSDKMDFHSNPGTIEYAGDDFGYDLSYDKGTFVVDLTLGLAVSAEYEEADATELGRTARAAQTPPALPEPAVQKIFETRQRPVTQAPTAQAPTAQAPPAPVRRDRTEQAERRDRTEQAERDRTEQAERRDRTEQAERRDRTEQAERRDRTEQAERRDRTEQAERGDRTEQAERRDRTEQSERRDRTEQAERGDRTEQAERRDRTEQAAPPAQVYETVKVLVRIVTTKYELEKTVKRVVPEAIGIGAALELPVAEAAAEEEQRGGNRFQQDSRERGNRFDQSSRGRFEREGAGER